jgi:membrane-associated progesterone receptor component
MKKRDFTLKELRKYDGTGPDGRVLLAVLGKIYDMTKGKRFYGPGKKSINLSKDGSSTQ